MTEIWTACVCCRKILYFKSFRDDVQRSHKSSIRNNGTVHKMAKDCLSEWRVFLMIWLYYHKKRVKIKISIKTERTFIVFVENPFWRSFTSSCATIIYLYIVRLIDVEIRIIDFIPIPHLIFWYLLCSLYVITREEKLLSRTILTLINVTVEKEFRRSTDWLVINY